MREAKETNDQIVSTCKRVLAELDRQKFAGEQRSFEHHDDDALRPPRSRTAEAARFIVVLADAIKDARSTA